MINKFIQGFDIQLLILNASSVGTIVAESMNESSNKWAIGFLIATVGILNLAKAYATIKNPKK